MAAGQSPKHHISLIPAVVSVRLVLPICQLCPQEHQSVNTKLVGMLTGHTEPAVSTLQHNWKNQNTVSPRMLQIQQLLVPFRPMHAPTNFMMQHQLAE